MTIYSLDFYTWRGTLTLLPQSEIRSSSIAPVPVMSREAPLNSTVSLTSQRNSACLSSCSRDDRPPVELYVEPAVLGDDAQVYVDTHIYIGFIFLWELWIIYGAKGWKIRWNLEGNFKDLVSTLNEMVNHYRGGHNLAFVLKVSHHRLLCWEKIIMRPGWKLLQ